MWAAAISTLNFLKNPWVILLLAVLSMGMFTWVQQTQFERDLATKDCAISTLQSELSGVQAELYLKTESEVRCSKKVTALSAQASGIRDNAEMRIRDLEKTLESVMSKKRLVTVKNKTGDGTKERISDEDSRRIVDLLNAPTF